MTRLNWEQKIVKRKNPAQANSMSHYRYPKLADGNHGNVWIGSSQR